MANIVLPAAISFCNVSVRPNGDKQSQVWNRCSACQAEWNAINNPASAVNLMQSQLTDCAKRLVALWQDCALMENLWFLNSMNNNFPSDSSPVFDNSSFTAQDATRPAMTGLIVNQWVGNTRGILNWLLSPTGSFTDFSRTSLVDLNEVLMIAFGPAPAAQSDAQNFINRCGDYIAGVSRTFARQVAVNPDL